LGGEPPNFGLSWARKCLFKAKNLPISLSLGDKTADFLNNKFEVLFLANFGKEFANFLSISGKQPIF
jgi:hypothetical protein